MNFLTLEDIDGAIYENQSFYIHKFDLRFLQDKEEFENIKIDFCTFSKKLNLQQTYFEYTIQIDNSNFTNILYTKHSDGTINEWFIHPEWISYEDGVLTIQTSSTDNSIVEIGLYIGLIQEDTPKAMSSIVIPSSFELTLKQLNDRQRVEYWGIEEEEITTYAYIPLEKGWNADANNYILVNLIKSDFQFNCTQSLIVGKVNTVKLGTLADYKPNGDMIGTNTPRIVILYGSTYIPARFDSSLNDYVFDIDLTNTETEGKLRLKVFVESNDVLNATETDIALNTSFENINNESKLTTLFKNGGIGRIGNNITLTKDITVENSVLLLGNAKTINMANHKFIVPSDKTFKAELTIFINGKNTIQQQVNSTVELTGCGFSDCTGFGSVIDCQTDLSSLSVENDFLTNITNCVFTNNDMCILQGGELNVNNCEVYGKIGNPNNPYFLYQTDGEATILQSKFQLSSDSQIESDIEFNSCIFGCGETASINGNSHDELQQNNINSFISNPQNNTSTINVTYYYPAIEDYITLQSDNGYCHSCSNVDYVFKNNVTVRRD